jgi:peroxiredoxin
MENSLTNLEVMEAMITNRGISLKDESVAQPIMLVFLRHFGCTFCREALADISDNRETIEKMGVKIVFVHMSDAGAAETFFQSYGLPGAAHISDPMCQFYAAFGLVKGSFRQLYGLRSWMRGFQSVVIEGNGYGAEMGDASQMPGIFIIHAGKVLGSFIHQYSSDRPNYLELARCCTPT